MNAAARWKTVVTASQRTSVVLLLGITLAMPAVAQVGVAKVDTDTDRVPLHTVIPDYPEVARRDRIEGSVQVCFDISRRGYPRRIAVRHSTSRLFEKIAMKAVRKSRWIPLAENEDVPGIKACRTFRFSLVPVTQNAPD